MFFRAALRPCFQINKTHGERHNERHNDGHNYTHTQARAPPASATRALRHHASRSHGHSALSWHCAAATWRTALPHFGTFHIMNEEGLRGDGSTVGHAVRSVCSSPPASLIAASTVSSSLEAPAHASESISACARATPSPRRAPRCFAWLCHCPRCAAPLCLLRRIPMDGRA